jgi:hypothetical protein
MTDKEQEEARAGRMLFWFARWHGGCILAYLVWLCFFTEEELQTQSPLPIISCMVVGLILAIWLGIMGRAEDKKSDLDFGGQNHEDKG